MKISIQKCPVPVKTMLENYSYDGSYTDCYTTEVPGQVPLPEYTLAFYTTPLFQMERLILKLAVAKPSTDIQAGQLASGLRDHFAAWYVEDRTESEILMCDFRGHTRSWLMVAPVPIKELPRTRLYFGSAVVPIRNAKTGKPELGRVYQSLLGFHKIYSILLLYSAKLKISSRKRD